MSNFSCNIPQETEDVVQAIAAGIVIPNHQAAAQKPAAVIANNVVAPMITFLWKTRLSIWSWIFSLVRITDLTSTLKGEILIFHLN